MAYKPIEYQVLCPAMPLHTSKAALFLSKVTDVIFHYAFKDNKDYGLLVLS
jgi:hypothetical protein